MDPGFGVPVAVGTSNQQGQSAAFARADHVHNGSSAGPSPATTVTGPDAFGAVAVVGTSTLYARQDHDHGLPASGAGGLTLISRQVLSSPAASITFSSVPATSENLILTLMGAVSDAAVQSVFLQFNGDSGANYDWEQLLAATGGVSASGTASQTSAIIGYYPGTSAPAGSAAHQRIYIPGYARTVFHKTCLSSAVNFASTDNSAFYTLEFGSRWRNTAAINQITVIKNGAGNFVTGTVATLYGES